GVQARRLTFPGAGEEDPPLGGETGGENGALAEGDLLDARQARRDWPPELPSRAGGKQPQRQDGGEREPKPPTANQRWSDLAGQRLRSTAAAEHLESEGQVARGLEPALGLLLQTATHHLCQWSAHLWLERRRFVVEDGVAALPRRAAGEGPRAREHLVAPRAEAEEAGRGVHRLAAHLLGRHVPRRPEHRAGPCRIAGGGNRDVEQTVPAGSIQSA